MNREEGSILQTPRGGVYLKVSDSPMANNTHGDQTDTQLLRHIASKLDELVTRTAKVERELLGSEDDRSRGLVFQIAKIQQQLSILWWATGVSGAAAISILVAKLAEVIGVRVG